MWLHWMVEICDQRVDGIETDERRKSEDFDNEVSSL